MSRKALPLMLNTVNLPTASAEGNTCRTSIRLLHRAFLAMRYQASRGPASSGCTLAACKSFLRLMTCKSGLATIGFAICEFVKRKFAICDSGWEGRASRVAYVAGRGKSALITHHYYKERNRGGGARILHLPCSGNIL